MAPNLLGNIMLGNSADPVQIISKPVEYHDRTISQPQPRIVKVTETRKPNQSTGPKYKWEIVWRNVIAFIYLHTFGLYGLYLLFNGCQLKTVYWVLAVIILSGQGITVGAHRLWAHRTYKAKLPLRIILAFLQTMAFQNHIYEWVRDHRVHHKFTDTDADPHNAKRGFFFSHMGWLMLKKHKDVFIKGKTVDLSDLEADPVVMFQKKFYLVLMPIVCFVFPAFIPWYYWGENWWYAWYTAVIFRYTLCLNGTWLVNSAAHIWGTRPYDKSIKPTENRFVAFMAFGEGWHNYHHVFPWDYKAAELGNYRLNWSTSFIDLMSKIGWAYDLKTASLEIIQKRIKRTGDGTIKAKDVGDGMHHDHDHDHSDAIWGWGDKDMNEEEKQDVRIFNKLKET
ncbi:acyl-CoA Delta-9 desaturase-like isoform X2 [Aethina tumida]|nr:acyl-CoA Delta-9 desaturase-like isoform X2 [Aethina tumida]XP_049820263.1 acyl-CoA Delta-9 desaturase-like isoform X2 [Aethina tumida]